MDYKASIDKVSMLYHFPIQATQKTVNLEHFEEDLNNDGWEVKQHWDGNKQGTYKSNYSIIKTGEKEGIVYLGLGFNGNGREDTRKVKIEFNPNKTEIPNSIYRLFLDNQIRFDKVLRCDLALDFEGMPMTNFQIIPDDGRTMLKYIGTRDNLTKYLKPDDSDGHLKIYDKTKERADKGITINPETTRIEITIVNPLNRVDLDSIVISTLAQIVYHFRADSSIPWEINLLAKVDEITRSDTLHMMADSTRRRYVNKLKDIADTVNLVVDIEEIRSIIEGIDQYTMEKDLENERITYGNEIESSEQKRKDLNDYEKHKNELTQSIVEQFDKGLRHLDDEHIVSDPQEFLEN